MRPQVWMRESLMSFQVLMRESLMSFHAWMREALMSFQAWMRESLMSVDGHMCVDAYIIYYACMYIFGIVVQFATNQI